MVFGDILYATSHTPAAKPGNRHRAAPKLSWVDVAASRSRSGATSTRLSFGLSLIMGKLTQQPSESPAYDRQQSINRQAEDRRFRQKADDDEGFVGEVEEIAGMHDDVSVLE